MRNPRTADDKWYQKKMNELDKSKYYCKCGHSLIIPAWIDRQICDYCGNYVYKNKETEFRYKLKGAINNAKVKN